MKLYDAWNEVRDSDVIGIDEAQFYSDLLQFCDEMADAGKIIILAALDGMFAALSVRFCFQQLRISILASCQSFSHSPPAPHLGPSSR